MEYEDYVKYHKLFGKCDGIETLNNPFSIQHQQESRYDKLTGIVKTNWFELTADKFTITSDNPSLWSAGLNDSYSEPPYENIIPRTIKIEKLNFQTFTVNGHKAHLDLSFDPNTGETLYYCNAAYPSTEEESKLATSTLRKHITKYKKLCRPIYRLLEGNLTDSKNNENFTRSWATRRRDDLNTHQLYEMLKNATPTPDDIKLLVEKGNSSNNYSYVSQTDFESSISRVIQRRRADLQAFALLEATNNYLTPEEVEINKGVIHGNQS